AHRRHRLADCRHGRGIGLLTGGRGHGPVDRLALAATATLARRALGITRRGRHGAGSRRLRMRGLRGLLHRGDRRDCLRRGLDLGLAGGALTRRLATRTTLTLAALATAATAAAATPCAAAAAGTPAAR